MRSLICILALFLSSIVKANDSLTFFKGSWQEVLQEAKKQNKPIFLDVYTSWCAPCKQMDKFVFTVKEVGDKYNAAFINYKIDAEKGEGIQLAGQFNVKAYPTYLFLDSQGYPVHRVEGYFDSAPFVAQADRAISLVGTENPVSVYEKEFNEGNREAAFLRRYITKMTELKLDNTPVLNAYFESASIKQLSEPAALIFLGENAGSIRFKGLPFLLKAYKNLSKEEQQKLAGRIYSRIIHNAAGEAWKAGRMPEMQQLVAYMDLLRPDVTKKHTEAMDNLRMMYYAAVKDLEQFRKIGYASAKPLLLIPVDSLFQRDDREFRAIMKPYLTGEKDSTKVVGFQEDQKYLRHIYSGEVSTKLYDLAKMFAENLDVTDPGRADALKWIRHAQKLVPGNKAILELKEKLETTTAPSP
ncbi:thioredoxin family protein [Terrimonas sp. NA20]|uniref:Thioredoxin family protein n=1 Tax=Terrimonas ginsenosidimutans TaxID=2908004 RepID=A0ABS9KUL5_9BACT|nr:thioredoxin fold domain-containing protein [Terrimonas ginsenosidimutans]MCG2616042.1 thioredoxin family protein [Terrimonas ginsenosidimutans]